MGQHNVRPVAVTQPRLTWQIMGEVPLTSDGENEATLRELHLHESLHPRLEKKSGEGQENAFDKVI